MKPPVARKLAVRHTKLVCMVYKHAYLNTLLLLHSVFMLRVVKMALKGEIGVCALNSHGNYIVDHGIVFLNFCGNPAICKDAIEKSVRRITI